jgi:hypothetical protein
MYGPDGWCQECGTPFGEQTGSLVMQSSKFPKAPVWTPNWIFDCVGVSAEIAADVARRFTVPMREVLKPKGATTGAMQLLPTLTASDWYDEEMLTRAVRAQHSEHSGDRTGQTCAECGKWRWLPISAGPVPVREPSLEAASDMIASPEIFGDGWVSFHHLLFRRALGEFLAESNPRTWSVVEVELVP